MLAAVLREQGVPDSAITLIPDEQEAIDAALRMGQPGDLLLVFADALTRSWKQFIKFKPEATLARSSAPAVPPRAEAPEQKLETAVPDEAAPLSSPLAAGFVRDERGLRFVGETAD